MTIKTVSQTATRPGNTTAYTAGDFVGADATPMKFSQFFLGGDLSATLRSALIIGSAQAATPPDLELWLFDAIIVPPADNAAFAPTDVEVGTLVAIVPFPTASFKGTGTGAAGNQACNVNNIGAWIQARNLPDDDPCLYGALVVRNAYVPVAGEIFTVKLAQETIFAQ